MILCSGVPLSGTTCGQIVGGVTGVSKMTVMLGAKKLNGATICLCVIVGWVRRMGSFIRNVKKPESTTDTPTSNGLETKAAIMGKARSRQDWTADRNWGVKRRTVATRRRTPRGVNGVADVLYGWWWLSGVKDTAIRDGIGDGGLTA